MQSDNKLVDDLAKLFSGAVGAAAGLKDEVEARMRQPLERLVRQMDLVSREEFEVVKALAETARAEQEALAERVAQLEARIEAIVAPPGHDRP